MKNKKYSLRYRILIASMALFILAGLVGAAVQPAAAAGVASLSVLSVQKDKSVTVQVMNMPANTLFQVRLNTIGTQGANGTIAGTAKTNSQGYFKATFSIPSELKGQGTIAIRVEGKNNPALYAYNWFYNASSSTTSSSTASTTTTTIPTGAYSSGNITVTSVEEDKNVTIKVTNAPANILLAVWVDWQNRSGALQGAQVGTVRTSSSGSVNETFNLPSKASDRAELRIRLQGGGYLAYHWFLNAEDDGYSGSSASSDYTGSIPYIVVTDVEASDTVTIEAHNFAKGEYEVLMGKLGTNGKNGIEVGTINIKKATTYSATFDIPADLENRDEIAIRIQSVDDSSYYAYTWFENE